MWIGKKEMLIYVKSYAFMSKISETRNSGPALADH